MGHRSSILDPFQVSLIITGLALMLASTASAEKPKVATIKSTIKTSNGDEPGTLKDVVKLRLINPGSGPGAPREVTISFTLDIDSDINLDRRTTFQLTGKGKTAAGKETVWSIRRMNSGYTLWVDGHCVDSARSRLLAAPKGLTVVAETAPFDAIANPYGPWQVQMVSNKVKTPPIVVLCPGPAQPIPVPYPIKG